MPWKRSRYPDNWDELSQSCKEAANWQCQECGVRHGDMRIGKKYGKPYKVVLASAHVNDDPENPNPELIALCQSCHNKRDRFQHGKNAQRTIKRQRNEAMIAAGQLVLLGVDRPAS